MDSSRLIVGVSGSSVPQLAVTFLEALGDIGGIEVHMDISKGASLSLKV